MSRTITIDGVDRTSIIRLESQSWVEVAYGGEVGISGFDLDDTATLDVPAQKSVTVDESAASPARMFSGYTGLRTLARGPFGVSTDRQWDVEILDLNTTLDDEVFRSDNANRPAETDYARVTWLLTTSAISALGITAGVVPNTNTVNMDAVDYRGKGPRAVLDECSEASGKNYFLYNFGSGNLLYYDLHTGTSLSSGARLSSVLADVDSSTTWALEAPPQLEKDPTHVYSTVRFKYDGGVVWVTNATTESTFRRREINVEDLTVRTSAKATNKANKYLAAAAKELQRFRGSVALPAAKVNDIRAGQRIEVKAPHLGIASFTWFRITRREVTPQEGSDVRYNLNLEFAEDVAVTSFSTPKGDGGEPEGCETCQLAITLLPSGMDSDLAIAHGLSQNVYVYDSTTPLLVKYRCDLREIWTITPGPSNPVKFGHESGTHTPVLVAPRAYRSREEDGGEEKWDTADAPTAAQVMDTPHYWQVIDNEGDITFVGADAWAHNDDNPAVVLPSFAVGDVAIAFAVNSISTAPSLPAGWTNIDFRNQAGGSTRLAYRVLQAGDTTAGIWTNGDKTAVFLYRGVNTSSPVGNVSYDSGSSLPKLPALTNASGTSWILGLSAGSSNINALAVSGLVNRTAHTDDVMPPGTAKILGADTAAGVASFPETSFGTGVWRSWAVELKVGAGGGGGIEGPTLQRRDMDDGSLLNEVSITATTTQIRRTPNGQDVFLFDGTSTMKRYSKTPALLDTVTLTGFGTALEDWNVDNKFNFYRIGSNLLLTKYNQDGEQLWQRDLTGLVTNYKFPSLSYSEGTGQAIIVDDHIRVAGYVGASDWSTSSQAVVLTIGIDLGALKGVQTFQGDSNDGAQAVAIHGMGNCLYVAGVATGTEFEDQTLGATRGWIMRITATVGS